jgi:hypothetical protein
VIRPLAQILPQGRIGSYLADDDHLADALAGSEPTASEYA